MKRLIYVVSVAALVFAASFSFVSCDDYVQDQFTEIKSKQAATETAVALLEKKLEAAKADFEKALADSTRKMTNYTDGKYNELKNDLKDKQDEIDALTIRLMTDSTLFQSEIDTLKGRISELERLIVDTLKKYAFDSVFRAALKNYVTMSEYKSRRDSIDRVLGELRSKLNTDSADIRQNRDSIDKLAVLLAKLSLRCDTIYAGVLEKRSDGSIVLSDKMEEAVRKAVESDITNKTNEMYLQACRQDTAWFAQACKNDTVWYNRLMDSLIVAQSKSVAAHTDIKLLVNSLNTILVNKINNLKDSLVNLYGDVSDVKDSVLALTNDFNRFSTMCNQAIDSLKGKIDTVSVKVDSLVSWSADVDKSISDLKTDYKKLKDSYKAQITSIVLQGTYNNVFGSIRLPLDVQSLLLAGHYGTITAELGEVTFPEPIPGITPAKSYTFENGDSYRESAGFAYLTINPNTVDIKDVKFELVNSRDENIGFNVDTVFKSTDKLSFGWTRANNGFYQAAVSLDENTPIEDVKPRINFSDIKSVLKQAIKDLENKKMIDLKSIAKVIYENSSDILDATAIKATWTDSYGDTMSVYTNYDMAATVMKPLSYEFDGFDRWAEKLAQKLNKLRLNTFDTLVFEYNLQLSECSMDTMTNTIYPITMTFTDGTTKIIDGMVDLKNFIYEANAYYASQTEDEINDLIEEIEQQSKSEFDRFQNTYNNDYVYKVNNFINKYNNYLTKIINKLQSTDFNHYLQPCILLCNDGKHFGQVSTNKQLPTFVSKKGGEGVILTPTSYTAELLAPAMYKYLAVSHVYSSDGVTPHPQEQSIISTCNNKDFNMNVPFPYKQQTALMLPETDALYEINYQAIDWSGKTVSGLYYIYAVD